MLWDLKMRYRGGLNSMTASYEKIVEAYENRYEIYAKKSFEKPDSQMVNGRRLCDYYGQIWADDSERIKIENRTPLQLERDRILYSDILRKQTEKYHVLYSGTQRVTRNYTTHTMRLAHVVRAMCSGLGLNSDFGEAIALGCKSGAVSFIHAAKEKVHEWVLYKINEFDEENKRSTTTTSKQKNYQLQLNGVILQN